MNEEKDKDTAWFGFYRQAQKEVSDMYPTFCICGQLCTGLHEMRCRKFQSAVVKRAKSLFKNWEKTNKNENKL